MELREAHIGNSLFRAHGLQFGANGLLICIPKVVKLFGLEHPQQLLNLGILRLSVIGIACGLPELLHLLLYFA